MRFFRLFILVTTSALCLFHTAHAYDQDKITQLAKSTQWRKLIHYGRIFPTWKFRSFVDGEYFFFSPDGPSDPEAELKANIDAFAKDASFEWGRGKMHPQCAFPLRYEFLKKELGLTTKDMPCPKFETYLSNFNKPASATLGFSSAYPNNPASIFGHTFIRVNSAPSTSGERKLDILDRTINFAAYVPPDAGTLEFMWRGLTGGYQGRFTLLPYYAKLNEYTDAESRDLWEYDINLTQAETIKLIKHTWEIEVNSDYEYYFLDENCSYVMLELLEAVKPEWDLTNMGVHAIPGETVKKLMSIPGAITNVVYRPSLQKKVTQKYAALSPEQQASFSKLKSRETDPATISDAHVLDAGITYFYYEKQKNHGELPEDSQAYFKKILSKRATLGQVPELVLDKEALLAQENTRPDLGHHAYRLGTSGGLARGLYFQELQFKFAYHDLMNDDTGYKRFSHVDFPNIRLRYYTNSAKLNLEEFYGVGVTSLFPLSFLEKRFSWKVELKYYSPKDYGCDNCHVASVDAGAGVTLQLGTPKAIFYTLGLADFEIGKSLRKGYRIAPRAQSAIMVNPFSFYKIRVAGNFVMDVLQGDRAKQFLIYELNQSYRLSQELDLRLDIQKIAIVNTPFREAKLTLNYYF